MQLLPNLLLLTSVAAVATASVLPRDYATVEADLSKLYILADNITSSAAAVDGTQIKSLYLDAATFRFSGNVSVATKDLTNSPVLTSSQADSVFRNITNTLEPKLRAAFQAVIGKKSSLKSGWAVAEASALKTLSTSVTDYGAAIVTRFPSQNSAEASVASLILSSLVSSANAAYSAAPAPSG